MTFRVIRKTPVTTDLLALVKATCADCGAKVRLRKLPGSLSGCIRLVITDGTRDQVRDAMVLLGAMSSTATSFTSLDIRFCWQDREINLFIPA